MPIWQKTKVELTHRWKVLLEDLFYLNCYWNKPESCKSVPGFLFSGQSKRLGILLWVEICLRLKRRSRRGSEKSGSIFFGQLVLFFSSLPISCVVVIVLPHHNSVILNSLQVGQKHCYWPIRPLRPNKWSFLSRMLSIRLYVRHKKTKTHHNHNR